MIEDMKIRKKKIRRNGTSSPSAFWGVMRAYSWSNIKTKDNVPLIGPPEGPHRVIPLFNTRKQAVAWAGSDEFVEKLIVV